MGGGTTWTKKPRLDKMGIPILNKSGIEDWAEKFVVYFFPTCLDEPQATPIESIAQKLQDKHGVTVALGVDLGQSPEGYKYRGRFHIASNTIFIDTSVINESHRLNFTLAHEIAHFVLHRKISTENIFENGKEDISDTGRELILDHIQGDKVRSLMEWQANSFAGALLLPRATLRKAVMNAQESIGITRNMGEMVLDDQPVNKRDYKAITDHLILVYDISRSAIRIRLRNLGILKEVDNTGFRTRNGLEPLGTIASRLFKSD